MRVAAIHQPQYLPYLGFFHKVAHCDVFIALDDAQFQKNGLQNRNKIRSNNGWQWLTVPVLHRMGQLIKEVNLDTRTGWQRKHWNSVVSNYSRAPFFRKVGQDIKELLDREWNNLCEVDMAFIQWAMDMLMIRKEVVYSSTLNASGTATEKLINLCKEVRADHYLSGPGGRNYMDLSAFEQAGITVVWQDFSTPHYMQVFPESGFEPNLSVVDVLLCCGPQAAQLLI